ncbi:cupin domain-containing protein [Cellulomonas soli]|uniref:cupin domain-containing protein n=1 Tax=Cellulomonas soli TaxID=931535 RepID=UPI003F830EF2
MTTPAEDSTMTDVPTLADLVSVQPESTVSRTVLRADGVRLVLFAFDAGQVLTEHTAAMPVLLQTLDGHLRIGAAGRVVDLVPGGVVHLDTRVPHTVEALEPSRLLLTMIDSRARPVGDGTGQA